MSKRRCFWAGDKDYMIAYHDEEWGVPNHDDIKHFEMLTLEGAQAGLSWDTVLKKRENYRQAFDGFDPEKVAKYTEAKIQSLLENPGIIRNKLKVRSTVSNAVAFLKVQQEFGSFDAYIWGFTDGKQVISRPKKKEDHNATSALSDKISKDLKKRGFRFVGSTIVYAFLQASGIIDDHEVVCFKGD